MIHACLIITLACAVVIIVRWHSFTEPLEADEAIMALVAQNWAEGGTPYRDVWENKPLGAYLIYRIAFAFFSYGEDAVRIVAVIASCLTVVILYAILKLRGVPTLQTAGLLTAYGLTHSMLYCHANGANSEIFIVPLLCATFWLTNLYLKRNDERILGAAFVILTMTVLIKQVTLPFFFLLICCIRKQHVKTKAGLCIRLLSAAAFILALHLVVYGLAGVDLNILISQFIQNADHVTTTSDNSPIAVLKQFILIPVDRSVRWITPFILIGLGVAIYSCYKNRTRENALPIAFTLCAMVSIALPGFNQPHYYILLLPFVIIALSEIPAPRCCPQQPVIILIALLATLLYFACTQFFNRHPNEISYVTYHDNNWMVHDRQIGLELLKRGITNSRVFTDGSHPGIIFYSDNRPATRYFVGWYYTGMSVTNWSNVFSDLRSNPPDYIVIVNPGVRKEFKDWLFQEFRMGGSAYGARIYYNKKLMKQSPQ
jgi:4-amino-4-deoxy-L-arabinose transferase-like glycosyltransferase